jgi:flagellar P-ring protein FlgI
MKSKPLKVVAMIVRESTSLILLIISPLLALFCVPASSLLHGVEVRLKDVTTFEGVRNNPIEGVGLVTGLNNTGGKSQVTRQFVTNYLERAGLRADARTRLLAANNTQIKTNNVSVVTITADLPIFKREGQTINVTVATLDDALSLVGGDLLPSPLMGFDGDVYAVAKGSIKVGGFAASGEAASVTKNHPTTGIAVADVEKRVPHSFGLCRHVKLLLNDADFLTAQRIADVINMHHDGVAHTWDEGTVSLDVPDRYRGRVSEFLSKIENLPIIPDTEARVVINERTGTVVVGENVKLSRAAITHANLSVVTSESPDVSQPAPLSDGETVVVPRTDINVQEENGRLTLIQDTATVGDLVNALNSLGASPRDLATIFQVLKSAGALHAQLEIQ